jgi:hypothetical protein
LNRHETKPLNEKIQQRAGCKDLILMLAPSEADPTMENGFFGKKIWDAVEARGRCLLGKARFPETTSSWSIQTTTSSVPPFCKKRI